MGHKVVGTPFSTFTRTITLGLHYKGIPFEQISTLPHSDVAREAHPYGYLPTLIIEGPAGKPTRLSESQAIVRYLDRVFPEPTLHFKPSPISTGVQLEEKMWEVVSLTASFGKYTLRPSKLSASRDLIIWFLLNTSPGFPTIEVDVIKPHLKALKDGVSEREILDGNREGLSKITEFLDIIDQRTVPNARYLFGDQPTWADFYLYPLLADLRALPEWNLAVECRFEKWMKVMDSLDAVKKTFAGTLADSSTSS